MKKMSIWTWLGAVFPILFLFLMMSVFHMKTERAAFLGIICAMISAILIGKSTPQIVTMDLEKGAFSALNILIVIWPAVFLYEMMEFAGVFQSIKQMLQKKTQDELVMVLLICWLFSKNLFLFGFLVKKEEICSNRDYKTCCYTSPLLQKAWGTLNPCIRRE